MPTKPNGDTPKTTKGLALEPHIWERLDMIASSLNISRNQLLEAIILFWLEDKDAIVSLKNAIAKGLFLTPLQQEVWDVYQANNNLIKPTAKQLGRQPEQIRAIVAKVKRTIDCEKNADL